MKSLAIIAMLVLSFQLKTNKPEVVVANEKENILTLGVENPLTALVESTSRKDIVLTTDNGRIEKNCHNEFVMKPDHAGSAKINVCKVMKKDTVVIGTKDFRVHRLPDPEPYIGMSNGGRVKKKNFLAQGGIRANICCDFDAPVPVLEYSVLVIRDSSIIGMNRNIGGRYTEKTIELLNRLELNDHLLVYKLTCKAPDGIITPLHPMEFTIEE